MARSLGHLPRAVLCVVLTGCSPVALLTRPQGDGGWSEDRRQAELTERARAAGVPFAAAAPSSDPATAQEPLTLARALTLAAADNRVIRDATAQVDAAGARVRDARGRLLPTVTGAGRYTWYTDSQTTAVNLPAGLVPAGVTPPDVVVRESQFGVVNGALFLPLDLSGELRHVLTAAQAGYRGEQARLWATTLLQQVDVIHAYFGLLETRRLAAVTRETLLLQRAQLVDAESRFAAGRLTKNEVLVVRVAVRNTEQLLLQRELNIARTCWALNQGIGRPIDAPCPLVDVATPPTLPSADEALRVAMAHNPAISALLEEQQRLEDSATALARSRLPRLGAGAAVDYSSAEIIQPQRVGSGFVGFTWDLGTDGRREAQLAEARIGIERARLALERQLRELEAAIRGTRQAAEERLAALDTAHTAVEQAEENLRIRDQQFANGRAESTDVLDAQALVAQQRAGEASALYQAHTRRAELQQLMGLSLEQLAGETK